jgi:hypothetical protein
MLDVVSSFFPNDSLRGGAARIVANEIEIAEWPPKLEGLVYRPEAQVAASRAVYAWSDRDQRPTDRRFATLTVARTDASNGFRFACGSSERIVAGCYWDCRESANSSERFQSACDELALLSSSGAVIRAATELLLEPNWRARTEDFAPVEGDCYWLTWHDVGQLERVASVSPVKGRADEVRGHWVIGSDARLTSLAVGPNRRRFE